MKFILSENQFKNIQMKSNFDNTTNTLIIPTNYPNYPTFYNAEKKQIYLGYVEMFKKLARSIDKDKQLTVIYHIEEQSFTTNLVVNRNKIGVLKSNILPFFEQLEEYEICSDIVELYDSLI